MQKEIWKRLGPDGSCQTEDASSGRLQDAHELHYRSPFCAAVAGRVKGLAITVIVTLALGIGANAAIFSVVRGVLLRPLVNRDEDRLIYIRQSARGIGAENADFSVPEIRDFRRASRRSRLRRLLHRSSSR